MYVNPTHSYRMKWVLNKNTIVYNCNILEIPRYDTNCVYKKNKTYFLRQLSLTVTLGMQMFA